MKRKKSLLKKRSAVLERRLHSHTSVCSFAAALQIFETARGRCCVSLLLPSQRVTSASLYPNMSVEASEHSVLITFTITEISNTSDFPRLTKPFLDPVLKANFDFLQAFFWNFLPTPTYTHGVSKCVRNALI